MPRRRALLEELRVSTGSRSTPLFLAALFPAACERAESSRNEVPAGRSGAIEFSSTKRNSGVGLRGGLVHTRAGQDHGKVVATISRNRAAVPRARGSLV